jgi:hypothetical protein
MWRIVVAFCSIPLSYFPCLDSCRCPISRCADSCRCPIFRCAIFALMFRAAIVAVLMILGFLFLNLVCGYALDYPCAFSFRLLIFESCMWLCPGLSMCFFLWTSYFWILYVVMPWIIRVFFPMLVFWLWGTLLICGIYGRGVGNESACGLH